MGTLITAANIDRPDTVYQLLMDLHQGLTDEQSAKVNARLVLILVNHIGDEEIIGEAIAAARR